MTWNDINAIILRILRRWWIVVGALVVVVAAAFFGLSGTSRQFETTTLMVVGPSSELESSEVLRVVDLLSRSTVMATYADVIASPKVVANGMVSTDPTRSDWSGYEVRVVPEPDSNVLRMIVTGRDAELTAALSSAVQLEGQAVLGELFPVYSITPLTAGEPFAYEIGLPWVRSLGIAVGIGLGLGVLLALWFDSLMQFRQGTYGIVSRNGVPSVPTVDQQSAAYTRR